MEPRAETVASTPGTPAAVARRGPDALPDSIGFVVAPAIAADHGAWRSGAADPAPVAPLSRQAHRGAPVGVAGDRPEGAFEPRAVPAVLRRREGGQASVMADTMPTAASGRIADRAMRHLRAAAVPAAQRFPDGRREPGPPAEIRRYLTKEGADTRSPVPPTAAERRKAGWQQNRLAPLEAYLVFDASSGGWFRWNFHTSVWEATAAPPGTVLPTTDTAEDRPGEDPRAEDEAIEETEAPVESTQLAEVAPAPEPFDWTKLLAEFKTSDLSVAFGRVFDFLSPEDRANIRLLSQQFLTVGSGAMRNYFQRRFRAQTEPGGRTYFSAVSSLGPHFEQSLADAIKTRAPDKLLMIADQVNLATVERLTDGVAANAVTVYSGIPRGGKTPSEVGPGGLKLTGKLGGPSADKSSKLHLKSAIGSQETAAGPEPRFLVSGSPNFTESAMTTNVETEAIIDFPGIAKLYQEYLDLVKGGHNLSTDEGKDFASRLGSYNTRNPTGVRAALAPFVNIGDQLVTELRGADRIVMRMFLISEATTAARSDPIQQLTALKGAGADVSVVVDKGQAEGEKYVRDAVQTLLDAHISVAYQSGRGTAPGREGIMHDKVITAHFPESDGGPERWTVMVGSSGLSKNVMENLNYENLLIIDDKKLFDEIEKHHADAQGLAGYTHLTAATAPPLVPKPKRDKKNKKKVSSPPSATNPASVATVSGGSGRPPAPGRTGGSGGPSAPGRTGGSGSGRRGAWKPRT